MARVAGIKLYIPGDYRELDYAAKNRTEESFAWAVTRMGADISQEEVACVAVRNGRPVPDIAESLPAVKRRAIEVLADDERLSFHFDCTGRMSPSAKARVVQDSLHGLTDMDGTIRSSLAVSAELNIPSLQNDASELLENKFIDCDMRY